ICALGCSLGAACRSCAVAENAIALPAITIIAEIEVRIRLLQCVAYSGPVTCELLNVSGFRLPFLRRNKANPVDSESLLPKTFQREQNLNARLAAPCAPWGRFSRGGTVSPTESSKRALLPQEAPRHGRPQSRLTRWGPFSPGRHSIYRSRRVWPSRG